MSEWVLPGVLKVEDVPSIDPNILKMMSEISTGVIMNYVNKFIEKANTSGDETERQAANILRDAYADINKLNEYLNSAEAKDLADTLTSLQYSDVSADMPIEQLICYRSMILDLLSDDEEFLSSYKEDISGRSSGMRIAYTPKLDAENYERVLTRMYDSITNNTSYKTLDLIKRISNNKSLFINSKSKTNQATVLRRAIYQKDRLKSILHGLDFLIDRKSRNVSPRTWRTI